LIVEHGYFNTNTSQWFFIINNKVKIDTKMRQNIVWFVEKELLKIQAGQDSSSVLIVVSVCNNSTEVMKMAKNIRKIKKALFFMDISISYITLFSH